MKVPPSRDDQIPVERVRWDGSHVVRVEKKPPLRGRFIKGPIPIDWLLRAVGLNGKRALCTALFLVYERGIQGTEEIVASNVGAERFKLSRFAKCRGVQDLEKAGADWLCSEFSELLEIISTFSTEQELAG